MRIDGTNGSNRLQRGREPKRTNSGVGAFSLGNASAAPQPGQSGSTARIGSIDTLIALQAVEEVGGRGPRLQHGHDMLDLLEDLKIDMLGGKVPAARLERLVDHLNRRPERRENAMVESVLDEIELRARVELAKLGREAA